MAFFQRLFLSEEKIRKNGQQHLDAIISLINYAGSDYEKNIDNVSALAAKELQVEFLRLIDDNEYKTLLFLDALLSKVLVLNTYVQYAFLRSVFDASKELERPWHLVTKTGSLLEELLVMVSLEGIENQDWPRANWASNHLYTISIFISQSYYEALALMFLGYINYVLNGSVDNTRKALSRGIDLASEMRVTVHMPKNGTGRAILVKWDNIARQIYKEIDG